MCSIGQFVAIRPRLLHQMLASYPPHLLASAGSWDHDRQLLSDDSGNGRSGELLSGGVSVGTVHGHGASIGVPFVGGTTGTVIQWGVASIPSAFTICSITRYSSTVSQQRILTCRESSVNALEWLHGHHALKAGATDYHGRGNRDYRIPISTDWVVACGRNINRAGAISTIINGVTTSTADGGSGNCALNINQVHGGKSDWQLSKLFVWHGHLPDDVFDMVSRTLNGYLAGTHNETCPVGYTMRDGPSGLICDPDSCVSCKAGKYSIAGNVSSCSKCDHGSFQNETRASTCSLCAAGTYLAASQLVEFVPRSRYIASMYFSDLHPDEVSVLNPPDSLRSFSSVWINDAVGTGHARSMLDSPQAWSPAGLNTDEWLEIDLQTPIYLYGIVTQVHARARHTHARTHIHTSCIYAHIDVLKYYAHGSGRRWL